MKDDTLQRNSAGFPSGTDSPYYMEMPTFSALKFVICKSPGCQAMHLNPTTRVKIIFKINPLDRVFPTWVMEGSPLTSQNSP